jgi:hypothetical protein
VETEQLNAEGLYLGQHSMQRGLVWERTPQNGVPVAHLRLEVGEGVQ